MTRESDPKPPNSEQGELFEVETSRLHPTEIGEIVEGGVYPSELPEPEEGEDPRRFHEIEHQREVEAQKTRNRRLGNSGKHSPLERDGSYANPRVGDYLPGGFGPVTERNYDEAVVFAQRLETDRRARLGQQPVLAAFAEDAFRLPDDVDTAPDTEDKPSGEDMIAAADYAEAGTQIKLEGLRDDDRAGFLPTTHREKSQGYELLDYLEPGKHEKGVITRLEQIFYRQQGVLQKGGMSPKEAFDVATDTVRSVIREWGDYYANARSSWRKLTALEKLIDETPGARLSLAELLDDEAHGEVVTQLIRYDILRKRRDTKQPLGFDPLWVREDRSNPTEDKHKTVEDVFTHQSEEFMAKYIRRRAQEMTVGEARRIIPEVKIDQEHRGGYWRHILELVKEDENYGKYAELALRDAQ